MGDLNYIFEQNETWRQRITTEDPHFFETLANQHAPEILWIGCSDARVPANQITGLLPGEIFVHRNIANMVIHSDLNALSVIQYAVEVLEVKHIIVCGHYECGGISAALDSKDHGLIDNWLRHIRDVIRFNSEELALFSGEEYAMRLTELNVIEQVNNLAETTVVRNVLHSKRELTLHGWVYSVHTGKLTELCKIAD